MSDLPNQKGRPPLFDFAARKRARDRARRLDGDRFLEQSAVEGLTDRLSAVTRSFECGLWIGETVPSEIRPFAKDWRCADFDAQEILSAPEPFDRAFDLAISLFSLQGINDLPGALIQIRACLKPDGLFLGALLGGAHADRTATRLLPRPNSRRGAASARGSRPSPMCATWAACCSARASPCPSAMSSA